MTTIRTRDGIVVDIPDGASPNGPEAKALVHAERVQRQTAADRETYDPTKGMGGGQKLLANLGAGIDTTVQGVKQLFGAGPSDQDLQESRGIKEHLAEKTTGGGLAQTAGELLPTIPLGMGASGLAAKAAPALMAGRAAPYVQGALEGAGIGGVQPVTSDESRLANAATGALGGAAAPVLAKAVAGGARGVGRLAERPLAALEQTGLSPTGQFFSERGGARALSKTLKQQGVTEAEAATTAYKPHPFLDEGPTASMVTQSPKIAGLERASRAVSPEEWMAKDQALADARWKMLDEGLNTSADTAALRGAADTVGQGVNKIYSAVGPKRFIAEMDQFFGQIQQAKSSAPYRGNPAVKTAVDYVEGTMRDAGSVTPELLHTMRKTLRSGMVGTPGLGDQAVRAASKEPFVNSLADRMDEILDKSSKGKYGQWKEDYGTAMTRLERSKADENLRNTFSDQAGVGRVPPTALGGAPDVSPAKLRSAINNFGVLKQGPQKGKDVLSTGSRDVAEGVLSDLDAQQILQRAKKAGTSLGGSNTAMDVAKMTGAALYSPHTAVLQLVNMASSRAYTDAQRRMLAEVLQDPARLRAFLQAQALRQAKGVVNLPQGASAALAAPLVQSLAAPASQ